MCSRSSSSPPLLPVGRVSGHRGNRGELTVRVPAGDAAMWVDASRFWIGTREGEGRFYEVQHSRAYRDRLVLKLEGIDDGNRAAGLRGQQVKATLEQAGTLPEGVYHRALLPGLEVRDEAGELLGRVEDVVPTGGADVLRIRPAGAEGEDEDSEILVPLAPQFVLEVNTDAGHMVVRIPDELRDLNR